MQDFRGSFSYFDLQHSNGGFDPKTVRARIHVEGGERFHWRGRKHSARSSMLSISCPDA